MRVKLCARCPYAPRDFTGNYDPGATLHVCAKCDSTPLVPSGHHALKAQRRRKCSTIHNTFGMAQRSPAPSVRESLVSLVLLVASDGAVYAAWHGGERDSGRPVLLLANSSLFKEVRR
jgi:hypothetical protein